MPRLRYTEDRRSVAFVVGYLACVGAALVAARAGGAPVWLWFVLLPIASLWCFSLATICHNSQHCPVFESRAWNRVWHVLASLGAGDPVSVYIPGHNLSHHAQLQGDGDPMRSSHARYRSPLLNYLTFFWSAASEMNALVFAYLWRGRRERPKVFRQFVLELAALAAFYVLVGFIDWRVFLLLVFVPHRFAGWAIFTIAYPQHEGCDPAHPVNHSRNFVGAVDNWLFFNNGYHGIHHIEPGTHWSLYPELHRLRLSPTVHPSLEQPGLLSYLVRHIVSRPTR